MTGSRRLQAAKARLVQACAATPGLYIGALWLDEARCADPEAVPDALYVSRFNPYDETLLYDVRRGRFLTVSLAGWLDAQDADAAQFTITVFEQDTDN